MSVVRINLSELRQFVSRVQSRSRTIRSEINRLRAAFQSVLDSEALQGAIKQAIDDNITQFHFPIINGLEELHHVLDDTVSKVVRDIQGHIPEDTNNGILQTEALERYRQEINNNDQDVMDMNARYQSIYNSMSDLMSFQTINTSTYDQALQGLKNELNRVLGQMDSFSADVGELEHLLGRVDTEINRVSSQVVRMPFQDRGPMVNTGFGNEMNRLHASRQKLLASRSLGFSGPISIFGAKFGFMGFGAHELLMRRLRNPDFKAMLLAKKMDKMLGALGICPETGVLAQPIPPEGWEYLEYLLGLPYEMMTDDMFTIFAMIFIQLESSDDLSRFLAATAEVGSFTITNGEVILMGETDSMMYEDPVMWAFCSNKMDRISQAIVTGEMDDVFSQMLALPPLSGETYDQLQARYRHLTERVVLLRMISNLSHVAEPAEHSDHWFVAGDRNGPELNVAFTENEHGNHTGFRITYTVGHVAPSDRRGRPFVDQGVIYISTTLSDSRIASTVSGNNREFSEAHYASQTPNLGEVIFSFVLDQVVDGVATAIFGPNRLIYDTASGTVQVVLNYARQNRENNEHLDRALTIFDDIDAAIIYGWSGVDAIVVSRPPGPRGIEPIPAGTQQILFFPTVDSQHRLGRMADIIQERGINLADHGISTPLTLETLEDPVQLANLYDIYANVFTDSDRNRFHGR